ncbi:MAG TPA: GrpB family protein, partial [Gaiellaceae bacterium]|nr:GrpB family protein [Gaiellaceae bacterium]
EHIGSTAVPGLPAKPVVDVQVSVADVEAEAYAPGIEGLGIALRSREPGHRYFWPAGDRPRDVQIHVCRAGSEWEREHLLLRDFLRADEGTRERYGRLKLELAGRYRDDRLAHNEAKTGFILDALEGAERWAARVGWAVPAAT